MTDRNYVIVFEALDARFDRRAVKEAIKSDPAISHWWNHVPNVFLVTTTYSARRLSAMLRPLAADVSFLVMQVDPRDSDGLLPDVSWDWIRDREREVADTATAS